MVINIGDLALDITKKSSGDDIASAVPLVQDADGGLVEQSQFQFSLTNDDIADATPVGENTLTLDNPELVTKELSSEFKDAPSFYDDVRKTYDIAEEQMIAGSIGLAIAKGQISIEDGVKQANTEFIKQQKELDKLKQYPFFNKPLQSTVIELAKLAPHMINSAKEGATHALALGSMGAVVGFFSTGIGAPVGAAAGLTVGGTYGVIKAAVETEGMSLYVELLSDGIPSDVALPVAIAAGLGIGVTEVFQVRLFGAGFKRVFAKAIQSKTAQNAMVQAITFWAKTTGLELGQEVIQEVIQISARWLAADLTGNYNVLSTKEEFIANMKGLAGASPAIGALSFLPAVGKGINVKAARKQALVDLSEELRVKMEEAEEAFQAEELKFRMEVGRTSLVEEEVVTEKEVESKKKQDKKIDRRLKVLEGEFEGDKIDRRTFERRKIDLLGFKSKEELVKGISEVKDFNNIPDRAVAFIIENPTLFKDELVEKAETKGIPEGTSPVEVGKEKERRKEERREKERRQATDAAVAEQSRILRGEGAKELTENEKKALQSIKRDQQRGAQLEFEGDTDRITAITKTIKRKDIPARVTKLKDEISDIDVRLNDIIKKADKIDKQSVIDILHRDTLKLYDMRAVLEEEITSLQILDAKTRIDLGTKKVTLRANEIVALQEKALKERIAGIEQGKRLGKKITEKEIKEFQREYASFISKSEVDPKTRISLLKEILNIQTEKQLDKALPKLKKRIDKALDKSLKRLLIDNIKELTKAKTLAKVSSEFKPQIEAILKPFSITKPTRKTVAKTFWAAKTLRENAGNQITPDELIVLERLDKIPLSELSVDNLQLIHDSIAHLMHLNEEKQKLNKSNRTERQETQLKEAIKNIEDRFDKTISSIDNLDDLQFEAEREVFKGMGVVKDLVGAAAWNTELISEILDGKDDGIIMQVMYNAIDEGSAKAINFRTESEKFLIESGLMKLVDKTWSASLTSRTSKVKAQSFSLDSGKNLTVRKGTKLSIALLARNKNSRLHLTEGGMVLARSKSGEVIKITEADLDSITESLTSKEKKVADIISSYFNTLQKQRLNDVFERLFGFSVAVEPEYFPTHTSELARVVKPQEYKGLAGKDDFVRNVLENLGIFKKRKSTTEAIIISDAFDVLTDSIKKTSSFIGLAEPLRNAKAMFNSSEFKSKVIAAGKGKYLPVLQDYLEKVEGSIFNNDAVGKLFQNWQSKIDVAILGGNVFVFLKQPVSFWLASTEINPIYLARGMRPISSQKLVDRIIKFSPHLRERFQGNITLETGDIAGMGATRRLILGKSLLSQKAMVGIHKFDKMAIASIWRAVEFETKALQPDLKGDAFHEHVAARAWKVIRRTQPTFDMKDRSYIGRTSNTYLKFATKYTSQRNKNWMIIRRIAERWNRSEKTITDFRKLMTGMVLVNAVSSTMIAAVNAVRGLGVDHPEDKREADKAWNMFTRFAVDIIKTGLGNMFFLGNIGAITIDKILGKRGFGLTDPLTRTLEDLGKAIGDLGKVIRLIVMPNNYKKGRWQAEKDRDKLIKNVIWDSIDLASKIKGVPLKSTADSVIRAGKISGLVDKSEDANKFKARKY